MNFYQDTRLEEWKSFRAAAWRYPTRHPTRVRTLFPHGYSGFFVCCWPLSSWSFLF